MCVTPRLLLLWCFAAVADDAAVYITVAARGGATLFVARRRRTCPSHSPLPTPSLKLVRDRCQPLSLPTPLLRASDQVTNTRYIRGIRGPVQALQSTPFESFLAAISPGSLFNRFFAPKPPPATSDSDESDLEYFL